MPVHIFERFTDIFKIGGMGPYTYPARYGLVSLSVEEEFDHIVLGEGRSKV